MNSCNFTLLISSLACCLAEGKTPDEINYLASILVQLGDTMFAITARDAFCESRQPTAAKPNCN